MRAFSHFRRITLLCIALGLMSFTVGHAKSSNDYKFKVHNNTRHTIKKVLASEDGKKYGQFDIGDGIEAGATEELVWDKSTDNEPCEQYFRVTFANREVSEAVKFNFCEKDLVLEFN